MRLKLRDVAQAAHADPKKALFDAVGNLDDLEVFHNQVLVATYVPPDRSAGGILYSDRKLDEDRFQGKCGLVLKVGPLAFVDDGHIKFGGVKIERGDWVVAKFSEGWEIFKGEAGASDGASVRMFEDSHIRGRVKDPSAIY
jgi:hypothetical protein